MLRELRWHGNLTGKWRPQVEVKVRGINKLYKRRSHLQLQRIDQLYKQNSSDLQLYILPRDKLVRSVVEGFNLQYNNVARQVETKCCPYNRTFNAIAAQLQTTITMKQPNKLSQVRNNQLHLLTVTSLAILKSTEINLRWLIVDASVKRHTIDDYR